MMLPQGYIFPDRSPRGRSGFTLVEVLLALGLFAIGSSALIALFLRNLYSAKLAREEVILALISKDVATKNQLAAFTANSAAGRDFTYQNGAGIIDDFMIPAPAEGSPITDIRNATNKQWLIGHPNAPYESIRQYNAVAAEFISFDLVKKRWNVDAGAYTAKYVVDGADRADAAKKRIWGNILMYKSFKFTLKRVTPHEFENWQFTDWDGYGKIKEEDIGVDLNQDGTIDDAVYTFPAPRSGRGGPQAEKGQPSPSHGVYYDSTGMRFYYKRLRLTVGWDLTNRFRITSGKWEQFIFPVYNPDLNKH